MSKPKGLDNLTEWLLRAKHYGAVRARANSQATACPRNALVVVGTHLDAVGPEDRSVREIAVRDRVEGLGLGWQLESVLEVTLGSNIDPTTIPAVRSAIIAA